MKKKKKSRKTKWALGAAVGIIAGVVGFFSDVGGLYSKWQSMQPIQVDISWYEKKDDRLQLVPPDKVVIELTPEDVLNQRVSIPVHLAIANKGDNPLEVVRVELNYDKDLKIESAGKAKIDPRNELLIYEHSIGTLESLGPYTPLETIDTIHIPFVFHVVPVIVRTKDGVPFYLVTIIGYEGQSFADKLVGIGVKVYCHDRPPLAGVIRFHLRASVQLLGLGDPRTLSDVTPENLELFKSVPAGSAPLVQWQARDAKEGFLVDYNKVRYGHGIYQYISIDGVVRRVNADTDGDGQVEYELYDSTGDGVPDKTATLPKPEPMIDWTKSGLSGNN